MGRVIQIETVAKERAQLIRSVALALRELMSQGQADNRTRNLAAYLAFALAAISQTVERTVVPWEKRGYWLKADRFRMQWAWTGQLAEAMRAAVLAEDWARVAELAAQIGKHVAEIKLPKRHGLGTPWVGAWERLRRQAGGQGTRHG